QVRGLLEGDAQCEVVVGARPGPQLGGPDAARAHAAGTVVAMVPEPSTRSPSYSTAACPGATPVSGAPRVISMVSSPTTARHGTGSAWARICTCRSIGASSDAVGPVPAHRGSIALRAATRRASAEPTRTVLSAGVMSST